MSARLPRARLSGLLLLTAAMTLFAALAPAVGHAADRIYWTNFDGPQPATYADLGGGAVSPLSIAPVVPAVPNGVAIDPAGGRLYFANSTKDQIAFANLDGSGGGVLNTTGATMELPIGVAIDPATRRIYWANQDGDKISFANLDGTGGGDLKVTGATIDSPTAVAIDPAEGRIYWTNGTNPGSIAFAALNGSGGADLPISGSATLEYPLGLAIDQAAKKIYWTSDNAGKISVANLDGSGSRDLNTTGTKVANPYGLALDPESGRVYWGNTAEESIGSAHTDGSGGATLPLAIPKGSAPNFPVLYEAPRATEAPTLTSVPPPAPKAKRKGHGPALLPKLIGSRLGCSSGRFASDLVESFLYREPLNRTLALTGEGQTIQVLEESHLSTTVLENPPPPIAPAQRALVAVKTPGVYRCQLTGTNVAGTTTTASEGVAIFAAGKAKLNKAKGTARLTVRLPAENGGVALKARGIATVSKQASGTAILNVRPKGSAKAGLARNGKLTAVLSLSYDPPDASPANLRVRLTLRHR